MTHRNASLAIHFSALLFGLTGILGQLIQASPTTITAGRAIFAALALAIFIRLQGQNFGRGLRPGHFVVIIAAGAMLAIHWVTFFIAVKVSGVAIATLGFASFPAFITVCERYVLKDSVRKSEWIVMWIVTAGLILVTPSLDFTDDATIGLGWAIASGFSFAVFTLINRRAARHLPAQQLACWENLIVALLTLPFVLAGEPLQLGQTDWLWLAVLGILCTALSHYLLVASLSVLNARTAGIVIALEPIYAIAFAALLFAEYPSARALLGGAMMIGAIVWAGISQSERRGN